jgi:hypothetical protein
MAALSELGSPVTEAESANLLLELPHVFSALGLEKGCMQQHPHTAVNI